MRRHLTAAPALAATLLAAGCAGASNPGDLACTEIGCESGLTVRLAGAPPEGPLRIELLTPGAAPRYLYDCPDPGRCAAGVLFPGFTGEDVRVRVTTAAGTATHAVRPAYTVDRPNGPGCPPVCRTATVTVLLPA